MKPADMFALLEAPGQRSITLIVRDPKGSPLPVAVSYLEQLTERGYTTTEEIPLLVDDAGDLLVRAELLEAVARVDG